MNTDQPGTAAHLPSLVRYRHPQIRDAHLLWLACTICGLDSYYAAIPRFDDERQLWDVMLGEHGWTRRDDGRVLCRLHSAVADCDTHGHIVSAWMTHPIDDELQWRYCTRCGACFEQRIVI